MSENFYRDMMELKKMSGLTSQQFAKIFGRSRIPLSETESLQDRAQYVYEVFNALEADTPSERRILLLRSSYGPSLFRRLTEEMDVRNPEYPYSSITRLIADWDVEHKLTF